MRRCSCCSEKREVKPLWKNPSRHLYTKAEAFCPGCGRLYMKNFQGKLVPTNRTIVEKRMSGPDS